VTEKVQLTVLPEQGIKQLEKLVAQWVVKDLSLAKPGASLVV